MTSHLFTAFLFICFIFFNSCNKTGKEVLEVQPGKPAGFATSIKGAWELREIIGGLRIPDPGPYFTSGNGYLWKFTDSTYQQYAKGKLVSEGSYILTRDSSVATGRVMDALILPQNHNDKIHFEFSRDTVIFYRGIIAADGTIEKYVMLHNNH